MLGFCSILVSTQFPYSRIDDIVGAFSVHHVLHLPYIILWFTTFMILLLYYLTMYLVDSFTTPSS